MINWRIPNRYFIFFVLVIYASYSAASEPTQPSHINLGDYPAVITYLNKYIDYLVDDEDLAGLSIAIVNDQHVVWEKGVGFADKKSQIPAKFNTPYRAGAVTGLFTAALITRLADEKLLNLDDDIKKYLPDLQIDSRHNNKAVISIRNLLTHHAGLPINVFKGSWGEAPPSFDSLMSQPTKLIASYPPETIYAFSNVGYSLLGLIVERVTHQSFSTAMDKYVFLPLKMHDTSVNNKSDVMKKLATGYKEGEVGERLFPRDTPSVGLVTTVRDLSRFIRFYFDDKTRQWRGLDETIRVQNAHIKLDIGRQVGFSWNIGGMNVKNAGPVIWRGGATPYYRARVAMLPEHKLGVVILSNDSKSWDVIEKIAEKALQLMFEAKAGGLKLKPKLRQKPKPLDDTAVVKITSNKNLKKDRFATAYSGFIGYIEIDDLGGDYRANVLGWPFILTKDKSNADWFGMEYDLFGFIPIDISWVAGIKIRPAVVDNHRVLIVHYKSRQYLFAEQYKKARVHDHWKTLLGEYQVKNADSLLKSMKVKKGELKLKDNRLFFVYQLPYLFGLDLLIPLRTLSDTEAIIPGLGTGLNETVSVKRHNGKPVLLYSGYFLEKEE